MNMPYRYKVFINCFTYNQTEYIEETLHGFTMQKTSFPFVCAIVDDASGDGEQEVLKHYLQKYFDIEDKSIVRDEETEDYYLSFARHKTNKNCFFALLYLKYNHYTIGKKKGPYLAEWTDNSEYLAICEGDDYWIAPDKLQKEVDYLDAHPKVGLLYTDINMLYQDENRIEFGHFNSLPIKNTHEDFVINSWFLAPCTWLYRHEFEYIKPVVDSSKFFVGDTMTLLTCSQNSEIHYINEVTAVYRVLKISASHFDSYKAQRSFRKKNANTRILFAKRLPFSVRMRLWWNLFFQERPSFKKHLKFIPVWLFDSIVYFIKLFF